MRSEKSLFFKNAFSNVITGVSSALFAIALPYFFVRYFTRAEFGLWVLVLQLGAYVNYLNFGVQVAIGRYVSHALESGDRPKAERILAAGFQMLSALAVAGLLLTIGLASSFPWIFREVAPNLADTARIALLWTGGALAFGLPFSAFLGVFVGLQRNDIPAAIAAIGKAVLAVVVIVAAAETQNLRVAAATYAVGNLAIYCSQYIIFRRVCKGWHLRAMRKESAELRELIHYCAGLMIWYLAMFLVNGLDTTIVGYFDFQMVAAYGAAISVVNFFAGLIQALVAPLIQVFAKLHARGEDKRMMHLLRTSSFACTLFLIISAAWLILLAEPAFNLWVGPSIAADAIPIFGILIVANAIRNSAAPYANYLVATGQQRRVAIGPIAEGATNVIASIMGAYWFGAIGVAIGTLAGGIVGIAVNIAINYRATLANNLSPITLTMDGLLIPILFSAPLLAIMLIKSFLAASALAALVSQAGMTVIIAIFALRRFYTFWI